MKQIIKLAWRNIWRKKRRSVIAIASVTFAVFLAINFRSLQWGSYEKMIDAGVKNTGYVQIHAEGYWEDKSINDLLEVDEKLYSEVKGLAGIKDVVPRLQNFALGSGIKKSKGVMVAGIDPYEENRFNRLSSRVVKGGYLSVESEGVMLGLSLAKYLQVDVGDSLVLFGQGNYGSVAAGKFLIEALVELNNPQEDNMMVFMTISTAQFYNNAFDKVSALMIDLENQNLVKEIANNLRRKLGNEYEIMTWSELQPGIQNSINTDTAIATMLLSCLYLIVGFGIIGTIIMMAIERKREFGMLRANGMQKMQIQSLIIVESVFMGLIGVFVAFLLSAFSVWYMYTNPIPLTGEAAKSFEAMGAAPVLQFAVKPDLFLKQGLIVFLIMMVASLFPVLLVKNLRVSDSIK